MSVSEAKPIYYAAAAGDILGTYMRWREGSADERQTGATYSGQFFDLCKRLRRPGAASFPALGRIARIDGEFVIRGRPWPGTASGIRYHLMLLRSAIWLFSDVIRTRAGDVVVMDGITHFFLLAPIAWTGRRVFLSIHTVLWREGQPMNRSWRIVRFLDRWFLRRHCAGCLAVSSNIADQVRQLAGGVPLEVSVFRPLYDRKDFAHFGPPDSGARPFRVLYAGRIEHDKGVFDLLDNVGDLVAAGRDVRVDFCGDGSALGELQAAVVNRGLTDSVHVQGHLSRPALLEFIEHSQILVVPTRSTFPEGLNKVVVEAILAHRPVVTSSVCPALSIVRAAAVEAKPDDLESYRTAIERLMDDPALLSEKAAACATLREEFFDPDQAWTAKAYALLASDADRLNGFTHPHTPQTTPATAPSP